MVFTSEVMVAMKKVIGVKISGSDSDKATKIAFLICSGSISRNDLTEIFGRLSPVIMANVFSKVDGALFGDGEVTEWIESPPARAKKMYAMLKQAMAKRVPSMTSKEFAKTMEAFPGFLSITMAQAGNQFNLREDLGRALFAISKKYGQTHR